MLKTNVLIKIPEFRYSTTYQKPSPLNWNFGVSPQNFMLLSPQQANLSGNALVYKLNLNSMIRSLLFMSLLYLGFGEAASSQTLEPNSTATTTNYGWSKDKPKNTQKAVKLKMPMVSKSTKYSKPKPMSFDWFFSGPQLLTCDQFPTPWWNIFALTIRFARILGIGIRMIFQQSVQD